MLRVLMIAFPLLFGVVGLSGCEEKGPMEKAGEQMDEGVEEIKDEIDDRT